MPEIIPNQKFIHDAKVYEEGESYEVSPEMAFYFKQCGWLGEKKPTTSETITLNIHDGEHGHEAEVK